MLSIVPQAGSICQDSTAGKLKQRTQTGIPSPREAGEQPLGYIFNLTMAPRK